MSKIEKGNIILDFDFLVTIKKISVWRLKKSFSFCEHKKNLYKICDSLGVFLISVYDIKWMRITR